MCRSDGCCNAKLTKNIFVVLGVLASLGGFILMIYGAAKTYTIQQSDADEGVNFAPLLAYFLSCRDAANGYFYSSDINDTIRYQHCLPQAGPVFFFIITALFMLFTSFVALYASFKETNGSLYIGATFVTLSYFLLLVGIYVLADESNTTLVQLIPCDGRLTDSEQTQLNTVGIFPIQGKCADGLAGTNDGAKQFVLGVGAYYIGSALGLLAGTIFIWGLAYTFTKNAKNLEPDEGRDDVSLEARGASSSQIMSGAPA